MFYSTRTTRQAPKTNLVLALVLLFGALGLLLLLSLLLLVLFLLLFLLLLFL